MNAKPLTADKTKVFEDIRQAVDEFNQVMAGKLQARDADELLNELIRTTELYKLTRNKLFLII